jgi:DtxR family transcriptional regulator, Mn-dependent transcriptional regulator
MLSENAEDYLACIYDLTRDEAPVKTTEIASRLHLSPASVTEMTQKLSTDGFLNYERYKGVTLTPKGKKVAERIKRRHRMLERFLVDILGVSKERGHDEAMKLEHTVSDDSVERLSKIMNNPTVCPDGDPIPPGDLSVDDLFEDSISLTELPEGEQAEITHLHSDDSSTIRRLIGMGFVPGRKVQVEEKVPVGGPLLVHLGERRVALARNNAKIVQVRREQ